METRLELVPVSKWGIFPEGQRPLLIAGPCSAESEVQVMQTARRLWGQCFQSRYLETAYPSK